MGGGLLGLLGGGGCELGKGGLECHHRGLQAADLRLLLHESMRQLTVPAPLLLELPLNDRSPLPLLPLPPPALLLSPPIFLLLNPILPLQFLHLIIQLAYGCLVTDDRLLQPLFEILQDCLFYFQFLLVLVFNTLELFRETYGIVLGVEGF